MESDENNKMYLLGGGAVLIIIIAITVYFILEEPEPSPTPTPTPTTTPAPTLPPLPTGKYVLSDNHVCTTDKHHIERELNKAECIQAFQQFHADPYKSLTMYDETINPTGNMHTMVNKPVGCSYCDRESGCDGGIVGAPLTSKGIVYYNLQDDVTESNILPGNKKVCFDKSHTLEPALDDTLLDREISRVREEERAAVLAAQAELAAERAINEQISSQSLVPLAIDVNHWGISSATDGTITNNIQTSDFYRSLYSGVVKSDDSPLTGGVGYTGVCEGNEVSQTQCEGGLNLNIGKGKCILDPDNTMNGSCGNLDLCTHPSGSDPMDLISKTATVKVYDLDNPPDIKGKINTEGWKIEVAGLRDRPPWLNLHLVKDGETSVVLRTKDVQYNVDHKDKINIDEDQWNKMKKYFDDASTVPAQGTTNMECPEFRELITKDIICNVGKKDVEMMYRLYRLQLDLDSMKEGRVVTKPTGKYRQSLDSPSAVATIPIKYQWEWLDAYLLYKEISAPRGTVWQGEKHHSHKKLKLNIVKWSEVGDEPLNTCGYGGISDGDSSVQDDHARRATQCDHFDLDQNRLVDYGLPNVISVNVKDTRFLLGGHDKASYHPTTKLRNLLYGKDETRKECGLGFMGILNNKNDYDIQTDYIDKFNIFEKYVEDWATEYEGGEDVNQRSNKSQNRNHMFGSIYGSYGSNRDTLQSGYWRDYNRFYDRAEKNKLQDIKVAVSPLFPPVKAECCSPDIMDDSSPYKASCGGGNEPAVGCGGSVRDVPVKDGKAIYEDKRQDILAYQGEALLNPIHWGGYGLRIGGEPTNNLYTMSSIGSQDEIQRILPFKGGDGDYPTRMKGALEAVVSLLDEPLPEPTSVETWDSLGEEERQQLARLYIWKVLLSVHHNEGRPAFWGKSIDDIKGNPGAWPLATDPGTADKQEIYGADGSRDYKVRVARLFNETNQGSGLNLLYPFGINDYNDNDLDWSGNDETYKTYKNDALITTQIFDCGTGPCDKNWVEGKKAWVKLFTEALPSGTSSQEIDIDQEIDDIFVSNQGQVVQDPVNVRDALWNLFKKVIGGSNIPKRCGYSELSFNDDKSLPNHSETNGVGTRMIGININGGLLDSFQGYEYVQGDTTFANDYGLLSDSSNNELMRERALWATQMAPNQKSVYGFHTLILFPLTYEWGTGEYEEEKSRSRISWEKGGIVIQKRHGKVLSSEEINGEGDAGIIRRFLNNEGITEENDRNITLDNKCGSDHAAYPTTRKEPCNIMYGCESDREGRCQAKSDMGNNIGGFNNAWDSSLSNPVYSNKLYAQQCNYVRGGVQEDTCSEAEETECTEKTQCEWKDRAFSNDYPWAAPPGCWDIDGKRIKTGGSLKSDKEIHEPWLVDYYNDATIARGTTDGDKLLSDGSLAPFHSDANWNPTYGQSSVPQWTAGNKPAGVTDYTNSVICAPKQHHKIGGDSSLKRIYEKTKRLRDPMEDEEECWKYTPTECISKETTKNANLVPKIYRGCESDSGVCTKRFNKEDIINYNERERNEVDVSLLNIYENMRPVTGEELKNGGICYGDNGLPEQNQGQESSCTGNWYPLTESQEEVLKNPHCELREVKPIKRICKVAPTPSP